MKHKTIAALAMVALLAACDGGTDGANDGRTAEGEVLGGTISDEMLPFDTVRSQSPPLRPEPTSDGEKSDVSEAAEEEEATAEPAAGDEAEDEAADEAESAPASAPEEATAASEGDEEN